MGNIVLIPLARVVVGLLIIGCTAYFIIRRQAAGLFNAKLACKYQAKVRTLINLGVT